MISIKEFKEKYTNKYILCTDMESLTLIINTYAKNKNNWADQLNNNDFLRKNHYNEIGIILKVEDELQIFWGYWDKDVGTNYIKAEEILNTKIKMEKTGNNMDEITEVLEKLYKYPELRQSIIPLFISHPGIGKSSKIQNFAKSKEIQVVEMIASQMSPFEVSGIAIPDKDIKQMVYYDFDRLINLKDGDMIFVDELLNGNPNVLNAFLTLFESRMTISGKPLPNIIIVAAANTQGMAPLTPQIKERFVWYHLDFDQDSWIEFMINKYGITKSIGKKLANLIKNEKFTDVTENFNSARSIYKAVNMILHDIPTPYKSRVLPILEELITNSAPNDITLKNGDIFLKNEKKKWIDIIRIEKEITL
jgi:hypothetical protein